MCGAASRRFPRCLATTGPRSWPPLGTALSSRAPWGVARPMAAPEMAITTTRTPTPERSEWETIFPTGSLSSRPRKCSGPTNGLKLSNGGAGRPKGRPLHPQGRTTNRHVDSGKNKMKQKSESNHLTHSWSKEQAAWPQSENRASQENSPSSSEGPPLPCV